MGEIGIGELVKYAIIGDGDVERGRRLEKASADFFVSPHRKKGLAQAAAERQAEEKQAEPVSLQELVKKQLGRFVPPGATTFAEVQAAQRAGELGDLGVIFSELAQNIALDETIGDKAAALKQLTAEFDDIVAAKKAVKAKARKDQSVRAKAKRLNAQRASAGINKMAEHQASVPTSKPYVHPKHRR